MKCINTDNQCICGGEEADNSCYFKNQLETSKELEIGKEMADAFDSMINKPAKSFRKPR